APGGKATTTARRTGAPGASTLKERRARGRRRTFMPPRAPHLYESLRNFCLGAFRYLHLEVDAGRELPFAFEEHPSPGRPALYEYRPLVRGYVEERARALSSRDDARLAFEDLRREPAAAIFARAHAGLKPREEEALFHSVL